MIGPYYVTTEARRLAAWGKPGTSAKGGDVVLESVALDGRGLQVNRLARPAFEVYEQIRAKHNYKLTGNDTGFYSYRHMRHDPNLPWSVHAWAMALDINWLENPAGTKLITDIPKQMIDDLLAVRTVSGARVFRWGGDWDWDGISTDHTYLDAMHWECVAHPLDLATGFKTMEEAQMYRLIYEKWNADDLEKMRQQGLWQGQTSVWAGDIGTYAQDWDHLTSTILANKAKQDTNSGTLDQNARDTANAASLKATAAHTRLDKLRQI